MSVTRILARNLSAATKNRIGGATEVYLDTPDGFALPLSKDVEKLSDLNKIRIEGALRASLDYTATNDAVLIEYYTPLTVDNRKKWIDITHTVDGIPSLFTRLYVVGKNDDTEKWEVEAALPADHWVELATQKKVNTIDFGGYKLTKTNVLNSWDYPKYTGDFTPTQDGAGWNPAYGFWPVDFGDWVDRTLPEQNTIKPVKMLAVEDLRPHANFVYLLKRGFCEINWTLGGLLLETDWALVQWVYLLREEYYTGKGYDGILYGKFCRIIGRSISDDIAATYLGQPGPLYFRNLDFDGGCSIPLSMPSPYPSTDTWAMGVENTLPFRALFQLSYKFIFEVTAAANPSTTVPFRIVEIDNLGNFTGEILSDDAAFVFDTGTAKFVSFDFVVELNPGQRCNLVAYMIGTAFIRPGAWFRCEPANKSFTRDDEIDLRTAISTNWNLLDALKAFVQLTNGRIETDYNSKTINVHPEHSADVFSDQVPGFIRDDLPAEDITPFIIQGSIKLQFIRPEMKRYTQLSFADSHDAYIDTLVLTEPLHSRKILNGEDLPDEIEENKNPVFEPTAEGQSDLLKQNLFEIVNRPDAPVPFLPRYWDNTDSTRSFDIAPRILSAFGMIKQINPVALGTTDEFANFYFDEYVNARAEFGYATQLPTWKLDPEPANNWNTVFGRAASDLFVNFYIGLTQDNRGGVVIELLQLMKMSDYSRYNFRIPFIFQYQGRTLRVPQISIRDFVPGIPTPVQYFSSPVETSCCDLPCSCRFKNCDYYQDFGVFVTQATMDSLFITSFKIDNEQILTAPVGLGQLNIVDFVGGPYVTNLVDALNSIGAPYFYFEYSTRKHTTKGLRFFKIKYPACQGFEIIISSGGDDVYKYTHESQLEQWFHGSYGSLGYGGETYTEPDNCTQTIEY